MFYAQATMPPHISWFYICTRIAFGQSGPAAFSSANISLPRYAIDTALLRDDKGAVLVGSAVL